ncbi:MAG TPA: ribosomal protein S18-alanine N-acetyltransferase [Steroidobacteraceae bacterium]|jgi:ribosomal-protein-alanine N-acetyltransferase|nr:ribosomal protein S18-alanine N-acetyltransferase [Steroidobacteraceae bacterium]
MATAADQFAHTGDPVVRPMREADVGEVIGIERSSYQFPWTEGIFHDCLRVGYLCRVAVQGQMIVGYAVMSMGAGEAHILNLCVREELRRAGVGRGLIRYLLEKAEGAGMSEAFLEVRPSNAIAMLLYQSLGFEQIGMRRGYYQAVGGREDAAVLRLRLGDLNIRTRPAR